MDDDSTRQSVLFLDLASRPVVAKFDQEHASSDGGAILLKACDRRLGVPSFLLPKVTVGFPVNYRASCQFPLLKQDVATPDF